MSDTVNLHATCVSLGGRGVVLFGESGSGKSDLALRLIDGGAILVGDDQIVIRRQDDHLLASPREKLHGLLETRGVGILHLPHQTDARVLLAVKLDAREHERLPGQQFFSCLGLQVPLLSLAAFESSTAAKIRMYLQYRNRT